MAQSPLRENVVIPEPAAPVGPTGTAESAATPPGASVPEDALGGEPADPTFSPAAPAVAGGGLDGPAQAEKGAASAEAADQEAEDAAAAIEEARADISGAPVAALLEPVRPLDAGGEPLPVDEPGNTLAADAAVNVQALRQRGQQFHATAAVARADAGRADAGLRTASAMVGQAERGVHTVAMRMTARRQVVSQANAALVASEQKTEMVASQAPGMQAKADSGKAETAEKAGEANRFAGENASKTPEDPEAAGNSREQGDKLNKVGADVGTVDSTLGEAKDKARSLAAEASQAKQTNIQARGKINQTEAKLGQADQQVQQLQGQNAQARRQIGEVAAKPAEMRNQAGLLDQEGRDLIAVAGEMETQLREAEQGYQVGMQTVPPLEPGGPGQTGGGLTSDSGIMVQRSGYEGRENVDLGSYLPGVLIARGDPSAAAREQARQAVESRRRDQLTRINQLGQGNFANATTGERIGMALRLYGENVLAGVRNINVLQVGGHVLRGIVDPTVSLGGVVGGLSMIVSGGANLLSVEQWRNDPLGNALKSAADVATGIAVVLGSVSALALVIIGLMTALSFLTLGLAAPVTVPVIMFCSTVAAWTLPATVFAGKWALLLQGITLIVNLVRAAAAPTAEKMLQHSEQAAEDTGGAVTALMTIVAARLGQRALTAVPRTIAGIRGLPYAARPRSPVAVPAATPGTTPGTTAATPGVVPAATGPAGPSTAGAGHAPATPLRPPAARHTAARVTQGTLKKGTNTVIEPGVNVADDVAAINRGEGVRVGNTYQVNGRTYGFHDGTLYPISGTGFHQLSRGAYQALGVFNEFGNTPRAIQILDKIGTGTGDRQAALNVWHIVHGGGS